MSTEAKDRKTPITVTRAQRGKAAREAIEIVDKLAGGSASKGAIECVALYREVITQVELALAEAEHEARAEIEKAKREEQSSAARQTGPRKVASTP